MVHPDHSPQTVRSCTLPGMITLVLVLWLPVAVLVALVFSRLCAWSQVSEEPAVPVGLVQLPTQRGAVDASAPVPGSAPRSSLV